MRNKLILFSSQKFPLIKKIASRKRSTATEMAHEKPILCIYAFIYIVLKYDLNTSFLYINWKLFVDMTCFRSR